MVEPGDAPVGAYGLRLLGVDEARALLVAAAPEWPAVEIVGELGRAESAPESVGSTRAVLKLRNGGQVVVDRTSGRAVFSLPAPASIAEIVHPYLVPVAAVMAHWLGRECLHAGAFAVDGGVWGVAGERGSGKSSTLAWLASRGHGIVCDDLLVLEGRSAFAAPRSVDLRQEAAEHLDSGEFLGVVGARERWRLKVPQVEDGLVLEGCVFLAWGDRLELRPLAPAERTARLVSHRAVRLPPSRPEAILDLAALPAWELTRPRGWESLADGAERLLELAAS